MKNDNNNNDHNDDFLWRIRDTIPHSFDFFYEQIMNLAIEIMGLRADKLCARHDMRVGIFGPYPPHRSYRKNGKKIILEVARKASKCGFGAITGLGFFVQNQPDNLHELKELMPPASYRTLKRFKVPDNIYFRHFPKLTCKAVHHLSSVRGQGNEAAGCYSAKIPMIGFVIDRRVSQKKRYCQYIMDCGFYSECMCPDAEFCFYPVLKKRTPSIKCPFYDYVDIPWDIKQLFINERNRLVAIDKSAKALDVVEECLKSKPYKRKIQQSI